MLDVPIKSPPPVLPMLMPVLHILLSFHIRMSSISSMKLQNKHTCFSNIWSIRDILKWPTLTKSASSSSSDNRVDLVASRDDGKSPRGQD